VATEAAGKALVTGTPNSNVSEPAAVPTGRHLANWVLESRPCHALSVGAGRMTEPGSGRPREGALSVASESRVINVRPRARILGVLGDIEFAPWQCIAELVDNSFDEFLRQLTVDERGTEDEPPTVWVSLPSRRSEARDAEVWFAITVRA
jgi:hypothetical protein